MRNPPRRSTHAVSRAIRRSGPGSGWRTTLLAGGCILNVAASAGTLPPSPLTADMVVELSRDANRPVIVLMRNVLAGADVARDQAGIMGELAAVNASRIKHYKMLNAFAATVSDGEVVRLKLNSAVAEVIPDVLIHRARRAVSTAAPKTALASALTANLIPGACGASGTVLLDPEALQTTRTASTDAQIPTARSLGFTGAGVKVAWIADGVDTQNVNFLRKDGKSAFFDYQDFSGDGPGQVTGGDEAFLDANAIAGQGLHVYDVSGFSAQAYPTTCNIRIEGMAPGASLLGLDVFGSFEYTTESNFLEAIEYAVLVDHVDVLNESFGSNPFPDITSQDATKQFNDAAVRAGVTVTVSSGDAGSTSTIGSPATDPNVIAVGASTTFRFYAQTNYGAARYFATAGWLNDNISSLSSGGFTETGATLDLVAPGDLGFAACEATATYSECTNFLGDPSSVEESGGTSLSAPLTAGAAALVIEAYRKAHAGASPTPAMVKRILTSSATDLGVPASEQGAGLLNTYHAVLLAQSIDPRSTAAAAAVHSPSLWISAGQLNAVDAPGTAKTWPVTVTNTGESPKFVHASGRTFGPRESIQHGSVTLTDGVSPQFANYQGLQNNYAMFTFSVPKGVDRLSASIAYPGNPLNGNNSRVRLILIDPLQRFAAHSLPQGVGNFGNVDVREPASGTWTGVIFGDVAALGGTNGRIPWQVTSQQFVPFGTVSPDKFFLARGQSRTIDVTANTPSTPGDAAGSIVFTSTGDNVVAGLGEERSSIPVTLRSLVDVMHGGGFKGVLTGGNGRDPGQGQIDYFEFMVGAGHSSIAATVSLANDSANAVGTYLVNPDGVAVGFGQGTGGAVGTAFTHDPVPGKWTLVVDFAEPVVGNEVSDPFSGTITLDDDGIAVSAAGLPDSAERVLTAGVPVTVPVSITNHGAGPESFFIDARLDKTIPLGLKLLFSPTSPAPKGCGALGFPLPLGTSCGYTPEWIVPTQTSSVQVTAAATLPVVFDYGPFPGDPDLFGAPTSLYTAGGSYTPAGGRVEAGFWGANPSEIGPYAGAAATGYVNLTMTATTKAFDPAVTSPAGDLWLGAVQGISILDTIAAVTIAPGQTRVIDVLITPSGASGSVISGTLYVDDYLVSVPPYGIATGDEIAAIPYRYTIK